MEKTHEREETIAYKKEEKWNHMAFSGGGFRWYCQHIAWGANWE
jgi:hypothetical protein